MFDDPDSLLAPEEEEESTAEWLVTYGDMVTLLLTFFVFLVAMSSLDEKRFESIIQSIQQNLGGAVYQESQVGGGARQTTRQRSLDQLTGLEEEALMEDIRQELHKKNLDDTVRILRQGDKIILRVEGQYLFASGSSSLGDKAGVVLDRVASVVKDYPDYRLDIKGHTDSRPISTSRFDSNWELSALRATSVLRYLLGKGISPQRLTATGYADSEPLAPNTSEENMAKNRRVEFVLEKKDK